MTGLKVSETGDYLVKQGKPFFYLADTVWSAFTNPTPDEWEDYLYYRKMQGFNVLQINILPQWDASESGNRQPAFETDADGRPDFTRLNEAYFRHAKGMLDRAVDCGFTPALTLLWCDYVPDTWASARVPGHVMPYEAVEPYVKRMVEVFGSCRPIFIISGDTDFRTENAWKYYMKALQTVKSCMPEALTTLHISGAHSALPEAFIQSELLDFYTYQSCHFFGRDELAYTLAEEFLEKPVKRPVINAEPNYEGVPDLGDGNGTSRFYRFSAQDVRKAVWFSLLSGAKAGIAYGAHGIWDWKKRGSRNFYTENYTAGSPFDWRTALCFPGAWDTAFARWIFEKYRLFGIRPVHRVLTPVREIRMSATEDYGRMVLYIPYPADVEVGLDLRDYEADLVVLSERHFIKPEITVRGGKSVVGMIPFNSDALLIATKK